MNNFNEYKLKISNFSPLHIGMGPDDEYTPFNSIIKENVLINFDTVDFAGLLTEKEKDKLNTIIEKSLNIKGSISSNLLAIRDFIKEKDVYSYQKAKKLIPVTSSVLKKYNDNIKSAANIESKSTKNKEEKVLNNLSFKRTYYSPISQKAIIPGSSIKGAIRTALLNYENESEKKIHTKQQNKALEKELFKGDFKTDPMRLIFVSDSDAMNTTEYNYDTIVGFILNASKKFKGTTKVPIKSEVISPMRKHSFDSSITIQNTRGHYKEDDVPEIEFSIKTIVKACNQFYKNILKSEFERLENSERISEGWKKVASSCLTGHISKELDDGRAFLLRVGRFSGSEAITIDGARKIEIRNIKQKTSEIKDSSGTMGLYSDTDKNPNNMFPMGWIIAQVDNDLDLSIDFYEKNTHEYLESFKTILEKFEKSQKQQVEKFMKERSETLEKERKAKERKLAKQQEEERKAKEEAQKQAEFNALSEDEKHTIKIEEKLKDYKDKAEIVKTNKDEYAKLTGFLSECEKETIQLEAQYRDKIAKLFEETFDIVEWHQPGLGGSKNKKKRDKQKLKKQETLQKIRQG